MKKKDIEKQIGSLKSEIQKAKLTLAGLEDELEKEPKFEVGKWMINDQKSALYFLSKKSGERTFNCYGFLNDVWIELSSKRLSEVNPTKWLKEATKSEVEKALIKEAKRRGLVKGVKYNIPDKLHLGVREIKHKLIWNGYSLFDSEKEGDSGHVIFKNGKWVEIIENKLEINGKEVSIAGDSLTIGCKSGGFKNFKEMVLMMSFWGINSVYHPELGAVKVKDLAELTKE